MTNKENETFLSKRHGHYEDCTSCRIVSGSGLIGMGIYVFTSAKKQKTNTSKNIVYFMSIGKLIENS